MFCFIESLYKSSITQICCHFIAVTSNTVQATVASSEYENLFYFFCLDLLFDMMLLFFNNTLILIEYYDVAVPLLTSANVAT